MYILYALVLKWGQFVFLHIGVYTFFCDILFYRYIYATAQACFIENIVLQGWDD